MDNRRSFIKKAIAIVGTIGMAKYSLGGVSLLETFNAELLSQEEIDFLSQFKTWVDECTQLVQEEKEQNRWLKNNNNIMEIAEKAEKWMPSAREHINNPEFRKQFLEISNHLTELIEDSSVKDFSSK